MGAVDLDIYITMKAMDLDIYITMEVDTNL